MWTAERWTAESNCPTGTEEHSHQGRLSEHTALIYQRTDTHIWASTLTTTHIPVVLLSLKAPIDLFRDAGLVSAWPQTELRLLLQNSANTQFECPEEWWLNGSWMSGLHRSHQLNNLEQFTKYQMCCQAINIVYRNMSTERLSLLCDAL